MDVDHRTSGSPTWPERFAGYRAPLDVVTIVGRIAALARTKSHHGWLRDRGPLVARGASVRWLDEAVELGASSAESHPQTAAKADCLQGAPASGLATDALPDGEGDAVAMIAAAAAAERWYLSLRGETPPRSEPSAGMVPSSADLDRYRAAGGRRGTDEAWRRLEAVKGDVVELRRSTGRGEVAGAVGRLRLDVVEAAATPASTVEGLKAKQSIVSRHAGLCESAWLVDAMIGASLHPDHRSQGLTSCEEAGLGDRLVFELAGGRTGAPKPPHARSAARIDSRHATVPAKGGRRSRPPHVNERGVG